MSLLLAGCATNPALHDAALNVNIVSDRPPVVRGYRLTRVPALLEKLLREDLTTARGTLDVRVVSDTYDMPMNIPMSRLDDPQFSITWFAVEFTLKDSSGQTVTSGRVTAEGPDTATLSSVELNEFAVVKDVAGKIRKKIA